MSFNLFPPEIGTKVFSMLDDTIDVLNLGRTCKTCYEWSRFEILKRIQRARKDDVYLEILAHRCDPLLFLCDLVKPTNLQLTSPPATFKIPKTFDVLKILLRIATPAYLQRFLTYHPININKVSTMIWFGRHLKQTIRREDEDPMIVDFMLSYIAVSYTHLTLPTILLV